MYQFYLRMVTSNIYTCDKTVTNECVLNDHAMCLKWIYETFKPWNSDIETQFNTICF